MCDGKGGGAACTIVDTVQSTVGMFACQLLVSATADGRARIFDLTADLGCGRELVHHDSGSMSTVTVCEQVKGAAAAHGGLIATMSGRLVKVCPPPLRLVRRCAQVGVRT